MAKKEMNPEEVLELMKNEFKKESVSLLSDGDHGVVRHWLDMDILALNYVVTGNLKQGFPIGRTVEFYGDPSTGKTLIALYCAADAIRKGMLVYYYDPETSLDREFASKIGADPDKIFYDAELDTVEQMEARLEKMIKIKEAGKIKQPFLVILDSLAMLSTTHEMDTPDKNDMTKARKMKQVTRRLARKMAKNDIGFLPLNHTIANITTAPFAPKKTTSGGSAIPFLATVRLELKMIQKIKDTKTKEITGIKIKVLCTKNKLTRPFRSAEITFDFRTVNIDRYSGLGKLLEDRDIIEKCKIGRMNGYRYNGEEFIAKKLGQKIQENPKWLDEFSQKLKEYDESEHEVTEDIKGSDTVNIDIDDKKESDVNIDKEVKDMED